MYRWLWGLIVGALVIGVWLPPDVAASPGGTDSAGGHTCRTNCPSYGLSFGEYHFHGGSSGSTGGTTTTPAPAPPPTAEPDLAPTAEPDPAPVAEPDPAPTTEPDPAPTAEPDPAPAAEPDPAPAAEPDPAPTAEPDPVPTAEPDPAPTTPTTTRASFERTPTPGESYAIQAGDTLSAVATRFGLTVEGLLALNPELTDASRIVVGQEILLREPTAAPAPSTDSDPPEAEAAAAESEQAEPQQPTRPASEPAEEPQPAAAPAADDAQEDDDGGFGAAGAVIVLGAVGIGALVWWRRRTRTGSSDA